MEYLYKHDMVYRGRVLSENKGCAVLILVIVGSCVMIAALI